MLATDPAPYTPLTAPLVTGLVPPAQDGVTADAQHIRSRPAPDDVPALLANMHASDPPPLTASDPRVESNLGEGVRLRIRIFERGDS